MAHRRRTYRAAAAGLTLLALLAGCGEDQSPGSAERPLTIAEALREDVEGPVRVGGILIADGVAVRLCSAILESYPPQCGGPWLVVRGLDVVGDSNMEQAKGIAWTSRPATLVGEVDHGVLTVAG